jgi:hypothetical protein
MLTVTMDNALTARNADEAEPTGYPTGADRPRRRVSAGGRAAGQRDDLPGGSRHDLERRRPRQTRRTARGPADRIVGGSHGWRISRRSSTWCLRPSFAKAIRRPASHHEPGSRGGRASRARRRHQTLATGLNCPSRRRRLGRSRDHVSGLVVDNVNGCREGMLGPFKQRPSKQRSIQTKEPVRPYRVNHR